MLVSKLWFKNILITIIAGASSFDDLQYDISVLMHCCRWFLEGRDLKLVSGEEKHVILYILISYKGA